MEHKHIREYSVRRLLRNPDFVQWVQGNRASRSDYWLNLMNSDLGIKQNIQEAIHIIRSVQSICSIVQCKEVIGLDEKESKESLHSILNETRVRLPTSTVSGSEIAYTTSNFLSRHRLYWIAATTSIFMCIAIYFYLGNKPNQYITNNQEFDSQESELITRIVSKGEKLNLKLPDGSQIKINSKGKIRFPKQFGPKERRIYLEGEAFVNVVEFRSRPFIIETSSVQVKVLGTSFNIVNDIDNNLVEVALVEGKLIAGNDNGMTATLQPLELARFQNNKVFKENFDPSKVTAWVDEIIFFESSSSKEVVEILENWYGVKFIMGSDQELFKGRYNGRYEKASLRNVLTGISYAFDFEFDIKDNKVFLRNINR